MTETHYPIDHIPTTDSTVDYNNQVFTCHNNTLEQLLITTALIIPEPTTEEKGVEEEFYTVLELDDKEKAAYQIINKSLEVTIEATSAISAVASSTPTSVYFLSFLNYFTLSSLYVLLNFPMPKHIYLCFAQVYKSMNENIFALFGINIDFVPLSD